MNIAIIACISADGALNGFEPSLLDLAFFKAMTSVPDAEAFWDTVMYLADDLESRLHGTSRLYNWMQSIAIDYAKAEPMLNAVLIGRRTWEDAGTWGLGQKPLPGRHTLILTRRFSGDQGFEDKLAYAEYECKASNLWIAGGEQVYKQALAHPAVNVAYLTEVIVNSKDATATWPPYAWEDDDMESYPYAAWRSTWKTPQLTDADGRKLRFTRWEKRP